MKLIYIEWQDAFSNSTWMDKDQLDEWSKGEFIVKEIGWVYEENEKHIILISRYASANNGDDEQFGQIQKIPKTWIKRRINLSKYIK